MSCVIFFNCHSTEIKRQLDNSSEFTNKYTISIIPIYNYLYNGCYNDTTELVEHDVNLISNADILIIQNVKKDRGFLNFDKIKPYTKNTCKIIKIPHYTFSGYFSDHDVLNDKLFDINKSHDELIEYLNNLECHSESYVLKKMELELEHIKELDNYSDIKMYDFVKNNYKFNKLFYSRQYPTMIFFFELVKEILKSVGIMENINSRYSIFFVNTEVPIFHKIHQILKLQFSPIENKSYNYNIIEYYVACKINGISAITFDRRAKHKYGIETLEQIVTSGKYR